MKSNKSIHYLKNWQADNELKILLRSNNNAAWSTIYDKYAAVMYGNILHIIKNKVLAEKIFIAAFISLKEGNKNVPVQCSMPLYLCAYVKKIALEYIEPIIVVK